MQQLGAKDLRAIHGLNLLRINEIAGEVIVGLSAKILGKDYPKFLNADTIPTALEKLNDTGLLQIDTAAAIAAAEPLLAHVVKDLTLSHSVPEYTQLWNLLHVNTMYSVDNFKNDRTLTFTKNVGTRKAKEYAKLYDKAHEFELSKNQSFRESLAASDLADIRRHFSGKARWECELKTVAKIRQFYGLQQQQPVKLTQLFESDRSPLSSMFERITAAMTMQPEATDIRLFMECLNEKETDVFGFCIAYGLDLEKVKIKYKSVCKSKGTFYKKINAAKELVSRFKAQQGQLQETDFTLLTELRQQIAGDM